MIFVRPQHEVKERSYAIRADFKRYDLDQLRDQLYLEQEGICAICKKPMQDSCSVICSVDHAISVYMIANWDWNIEKAIEVANARCNLQLVHINPCNVVKGEVDYEEFMDQIQRGDIVLGNVPKLTPEKIQQLKQELSERGEKGGRVSGRKNAESGQFARMLELPRTEAQRASGIRNLRKVSHEARVASGTINGRIRGRMAVESGELARIRELPQTKEALRKLRTREFQQAAGRKSAEKLGPEGLAARGRKGGPAGGRAQGRKNVDSGHLARVNHNQWHAKRSIVKSDCALCTQVSA